MSRLSSSYYLPSKRGKEEDRIAVLFRKTVGPAMCALGLFCILLVAEFCPDLTSGTRFPGMVLAGIMAGIAILLFFLRAVLRRFFSK